jgi:hypothetical protein
MLLEIACVAMGLVAVVSTSLDKVEYAVVALLFAIYFRLSKD